MNLAIFSPSHNPYSETFVQAHKNNIKADKLHYIYGGSLETMTIENEGRLINPKKRLLKKIITKAFKNNNKPSFTTEAAKKLKSLKINVALVEYGNHAMKLADVFNSANIPFVVHFHGFDISVEKIVEQNNNYKELFDSASYVIGVSKLMCKRLHDLGCPKNKIVYTACAADPDFVNIRPVFETKQAISIGRFVDKKAPYYTILAFKKVVEVFPESKLIMVGDGVLMNTCKNLIRYHGLNDNINLIGSTTPTKIKELMQNSYCFIQHSVTAQNGNQEGTPVAVMEAALAGLPVISTNHAGIPDVIEHEKTGLLSNEHDIDGMVKNIIRLLEDTNLAKKVGANAKKIHKENFGMDKHIRIIEDLLSKSFN